MDFIRADCDWGKWNNGKIIESVIEFGPANLCISSVTYSELLVGAINKMHQKKLKFNL